jgi:hypothetical protein
VTTLLKAQGDLLHLAIVFVRLESMEEILLFRLLVMTQRPEWYNICCPDMRILYFSNFVWMWFATHIYRFPRAIPKEQVLAMDKLVCVCMVAQSQSDAWFSSANLNHLMTIDLFTLHVLQASSTFRCSRTPPLKNTQKRAWKIEPEICMDRGCNTHSVPSRESEHTGSRRN